MHHISENYILSRLYLYLCAFYYREPLGLRTINGVGFPGAKATKILIIRVSSAWTGLHTISANEMRDLH